MDALPSALLVKVCPPEKTFHGAANTDFFACMRRLLRKRLRERMSRTGKINKRVA